MSAVPHFWEPEDLSSEKLVDEREVMATRFPDTRLPFIDDLAIKLDGVRASVEGVVDEFKSSLMPFLQNPRRDIGPEMDFWSSDDLADPNPIEVARAEPDKR